MKIKLNAVNINQFIKVQYNYIEYLFLILVKIIYKH